MGYILRFRGPGRVPEVDRATIRRLPGVTVVDDTERMLLIRASPSVAEGLGKLLPGWAVVPERTIPLPDARAKLDRGPGD